ncbi:MAG: carboxylating nicotinate-nucleotide diphosphorylase [Armatimonadetes bacterium]|jgi:nicotinate-nucleotide pyrophosphorylase (carboxylating)|nr:carboxylating nicotinate-nucleotide diphosphorylase [Armatimonadota bacterium]
MISETSRALVKLALAEDIGHGDATSRCCVPFDAQAIACIVARMPLVLSGMSAAEEVFRQVDASIVFKPFHLDASVLPKGERIAMVTGPARSVLTAERTALNFLQALSGIATLTKTYVDLVDGTGARIVDTRKTPPGMRDLAKAAVRDGGGHNHRTALDDGILIKDNHIVAAGSVTQAVQSAKENGGYLLRMEVECATLSEVREALIAGADIILLDNMDTDTLRQAVALCRDRARTEASGGVNLNTVREIAETGVDFISVGALTHSAPAVDIALDFE